MCGRFALSKLPAELMDEFEIHTGKSAPILPADWNIAPSRQIYLVRNGAENQRELVTASWGMIAPWSKDRQAATRSQSQAINARSESIGEKPTFKSAIRQRRCLIPADGYYECATELGPFSPKQPFYISGNSGTSGTSGTSTTPHYQKNSRSQKSLAFAGIWNSWVAPDGEMIESASIITRPAVGFLATVHSRMPTFLPVDRWASWLDRSMQDIEVVRKLMVLDQADLGLRVVPVSSKVNSIRNAGADLILPIELGEPEVLF